MMKKPTLEVVPTNCFWHSRMERAIQDWKIHFISGLETIDLIFPIATWSDIVPQSEIRLNHFRSYILDHSFSACKGIHGKNSRFWWSPYIPPRIQSRSIIAVKSMKVQYNPRRRPRVHSQDIIASDKKFDAPRNTAATQYVRMPISKKSSKARVFNENIGKKNNISQIIFRYSYLF